LLRKGSGVSDTQNMGNEGSLNEFISESEEIIEHLNADLMKLDEPGGASPDLLNSIFRSAHSLKGLSGMFGFTLMERLTHNLEELLDGVRLGRVEMTVEVTDMLLEALSVIRVLLDSKSRGVEPGVSVDAVVDRIKATIQKNQAKAGDTSITDGVDPAILNVLTEFEEHRLITCLKEHMHIFRVTASFPIATFDQGLDELTAVLKQNGETITTLPSPGSTPGETIDFDIILATRARKDDIARVIDNKNVRIESAVKGGHEAAPKAEVERAAEHLPQEQPVSDEGLKSISRTVRVDISMLDGLMNVVGELSLIKAYMGGVIDTIRYKWKDVELAAAFSKAHMNLDKKLTELQQGLLEARMVPLSQVFDKLARTVRKLARDLGKDVTFEMRGEETRLDKLIVEELGGPLMHIIRNCIDHGIELPADRKKAGKDPRGTILANAFQRGNHVVIEVSDDGKGIDPDKILKKAVSMGLADAGAKYKREDILNFMFLPGFSTSEKVSEISGRGVGMDVVKSNIAALSGMVNIESTLGKGTTMSLVLPMTLAIMRALITETGGRRFAVPLNSILETFILEPSSIETVEEKEYVHLRDTNIPLVRVGNFLGITKEGGRAKYVIVVGLAEKRLGLVVDDLKGQQDIVIKSIGKRLKNIGVIAGATDYKQETILVLDVGGIIEEFMGGRTSYSGDKV